MVMQCFVLSPHRKKVVGSIPRQGPFSMEVLHFPPASVQVLHLPPSVQKYTYEVNWNPYTIHYMYVSASLSLFVSIGPCNERATCPGCHPVFTVCHFLNYLHNNTITS